MKIVVLVKQVPDTWGQRALDLQTGRIDRVLGENVVDEINERALEVGLIQQDTMEAEVIVLTMGPGSASDAIKKSLAMGADSAIHINDDLLVGADYMRTAQTIAAALKSVPFDLLIAGDKSTDGGGGVIPAMVSEILGIPHLTHLDSVTIEASKVSGERSNNNGSVRAHATLPAVISVTERSAEPRYPTFRGIMKAKKKPVISENLSSISLDSVSPVSDNETTAVLTVEARAERIGGIKIIDEGDAGNKIAEFLALNRLI
ncbi:electron transfer flavoprotein subunit beta/FixA family protein [Cryobacterium ruanii]|uniref:Electron transfer flavoprotein subunit beta n=1 Tax=Cryobacterium ruanii TaxID=1259197 RepID=A0A4R9AKR9_9MICO|nr:electron transfer flavoprotein subunit beta/FixA family protein [Cryobacterium ruanii]TFD64254.1 electron transfer flavoprotein subunit beta/FixA family protein [Cryobacterium ruanii]